jgi:shikimate kinase
MPAGERTPIGRVVLVGFMASGKSTVGRRLAERLGWTFVDFDDEIERRTGRAVSQIFADDGEARFRDLEAALTSELAGMDSAVLAPGGGWITQPELLQRLAPGTLLVWLRISPPEAVERAATSGAHRPLLDGADPLAKAERLLRAREPYYRLADLVIDVDGRAPDSIAAEIEARMATIGGQTERED